MIDIIKNKIKTELDILEIEIIDESSAHANHKGNNGGGHYRALIISDDFNNKNLVERQLSDFKSGAPFSKGSLARLLLVAI